MRAALARLEAHPWPLLALVMVAAAVVILEAGAGASFSGDELNYFGREADVAHPPVHYDSLSLEYLLAPHNSHLQVGGKLVYEASFALFGADYTPLRILELLLALVCIALFFELARARVGAPAALLLAVLLCFLGAAWEVLLWPFDMHTAAALAAGLGALLVLERGGGASRLDSGGARPRLARADLAACALLVCSIAFFEVGIAFVAAVGVSILMRPDRWRRIWVVAVPLLLYGAWYLWARRFEITPIGLDTVDDVPGAMFDALRAVMIALTGRLPTGDDAPVPHVGLTTFGTVLALVALGLFALRLRAGSLPKTIWPLLTALVVYWIFIGLAERPPDSSRYVFAGAVLVLLVAADALRDRRPGSVAIGVLGLLVAFSLPWNIAKLQDGSEYLAKDADLTRGEFAMLELAGANAAPDFVPGRDGIVLGFGGSPYLVMDTGSYADAADRIGSLADPLDEVRGETFFLRRVDDVLLARALGLGVEPTEPPDPIPADCAVAEQAPGAVEAPPDGLLVEVRDPAVRLSLSRFVTEGPALPIGDLAEGDWVRISLPPEDAAPEPWRLFYDGLVRVCPLAD